MFAGMLAARSLANATGVPFKRKKKCNWRFAVTEVDGWRSWRHLPLDRSALKRTPTDSGFSNAISRHVRRRIPSTCTHMYSHKNLVMYHYHVRATSMKVFKWSSPSKFRTFTSKLNFSRFSKRLSFFIHLQILSPSLYSWRPSNLLSKI